MMRGRLSLLLHDRRGAAASELVLILPLLLVLIFTALEAAHFLYVEHQIVKGVRDGARFAGRQGFSNYSCPSTINSTTTLTAIKNVTRFGEVAVSGTATPRVSTWTDADTTVTLSCVTTSGSYAGIYTDMTSAPRVTVSARVPYPSLFNLLTGLTTSYHVYAADQAAVVGV